MNPNETQNSECSAEVYLWLPNLQFQGHGHLLCRVWRQSQGSGIRFRVALLWNLRQPQNVIGVLFRRLMAVQMDPLGHLCFSTPKYILYLTRVPSTRKLYLLFKVRSLLYTRIILRSPQNSTTIQAPIVGGLSGVLAAVVFRIEIQCTRGSRGFQVVGRLCW